MNKKYFKTKRFLTSIMLICMSIVIFYIILKVCENNIKNPTSKDYIDIPYTEFMEELHNGEINIVYSDEKILPVYIVKNNGETQKTTNPLTEDFRIEILENGAILKQVGTLVLGDKEFANKVGTAAVFFAIFWITMLIYITKDYEEFNKNDASSSFKRKKKKALASGSSTVDWKSAASDNIEYEDNYDYKTFKDIAGLTEVKKDMKCLVDFLVNKDKYIKAGAKLPKGVILYGPPGTGKTLLAKAVANEADVPFFYMSGSDFIEMYVGVGAKRIRELFEKAQKQAPCIIFIDEIDAIGGKRREDTHGEDRKTINALLTEMDGFEESDDIIVIAATNRIEDLDSALLRPGRFTDKFCVPLPETAEERLEIIKLYTKNKHLAEDIDLNALAKETVGFSPAKIEALLNESAIISVQNNREFIIKDDIDNAMYKILMHGHMKENQDSRDKNELEIVAWHEAGHALIGRLFNKEITKVTIISSTSGAGGVTFSTPNKLGLHSVEDLEHEVMELYGGRIAELILNEGNKSKITTGASNDIERATAIIHEIVTKYGMNDKFGLLNLEASGVDKEFIIQEEINIAKNLEENTYKIMNDNIDKLRKIAELLLDKETIHFDDLKTII